MRVVRLCNMQYALLSHATAANLSVLVLISYCTFVSMTHFTEEISYHFL